MRRPSKLLGPFDFSLCFVSTSFKSAFFFLCSVLYSPVRAHARFNGNALRPRMGDLFLRPSCLPSRARATTFCMPPTSMIEAFLLISILVRRDDMWVFVWLQFPFACRLSILFVYMRSLYIILAAPYLQPVQPLFRWVSLALPIWCNVTYLVSSHPPREQCLRTLPRGGHSEPHFLE